MSGYQSGNIDISSLITSGNTTFNNSYNGFPSGTYTSNNWENPTPLGYQNSGTDIANGIQAIYTNYTSNNTFTPPSWCYTLKIIAIGGGGGGGSGGANTNNNRAGCGGSGGGGGLGIVVNSGHQQSSATYNITFSGAGTGGAYQNTLGDGGYAGNTGTNITINANGNGFMSNTGSINVYGGGGGGGGPGTDNNNNDSNGGKASSTGGINSYNGAIGTTNSSFLSGYAGNGGGNQFVGSSGVVQNYNSNNDPPALNSNIDYSSNGNSVQNNNTEINNVPNPPTGQGGVGGWNSNNNNGYPGQNGGPALVRVYYMA
jgi:hypothetical protein